MKFTKKYFLTSATAFICITSICGCNTKPHTGEKLSVTEIGSGATLSQSEERYLLPDGKIAGQDAALIRLQAKVSNINYKYRRLTLISPDNQSLEIVAGLEVKNFDQIKSGDQVSVAYYMSVAFEVRQPTPEEINLANTAVEIAATAPKGKKPAAFSASAQIKIATVESVNKKNQTVTLKGLEGPDTLTQVKAKYPENLATIKVGDKAVISVTEAHAVSIDKI